MPASRGKNILYRMALPFFSPSVSSNPLARSNGHPVICKEKLLSILGKNHVTGGAILFSGGVHEGLVYTRAFHTDMIPDEKTCFRVASITKMATALLSVRLMDMGILDPDAPLSKLLPRGDQIEILKRIHFHHLLSHTSGLEDPPDLVRSLKERRSYSETLAGVKVHSPGTSFLYSNLGFGLIGSVIETLLGISVEQAFQEYCFGPLEMNATLDASSLSDDQVMPLIRVCPYHAGREIRKPSLPGQSLEAPDPEYHYGYTAGSLYTDILSLKKMISCIRNMGKPLISPAFAGYMTREHARYGPAFPTLSYGAGLLIIRDRRISDHTVYGHQGFAYGCVDGAFWEAETGNMIISLNGGASEARSGRLGLLNLNLCQWAFREELPQWK